MAEDAIVVDGDAAIRRHQLAVGQLHQRVDLGSAGVILLCQPEEADQHVGQVDLQLAADAGPAHQVTRLEDQQAGADVHMHAGHLVGVGRRDLFDAGAADAGEEDHRLLGGIVDDHAGVELAGDFQALLDQHLLDGKALDLQAEHVLRGLFGLGRVAGLLDAAQAGPARHPGLRLDHRLTADLLGDGARLLGCARHPALGDGDFVLLQKLFALVFV